MLQNILRTFGLALARRALKEQPARRTLHGLRETVEVLRDEHGVPHIFAGSARDLFFAQGYLHAESRLWQMDVIRRAASGRLSEIFGDAPVAHQDLGVRWRGRRMPEFDRWLRILGLRRAAEAALGVLGGEAREALDAYVAGVNRWIEDTPARGRPVEMKLLGYEPEPWTAVDSLSVPKIMAVELSYALKHKLALVALAERLAADPDRLREILPPPTAAEAPRIVAGWGGAGERAAAIAAADGQFRPFIGWGGHRLGSNWCVLGPSRTTTGKPLLLNDPHLPLTAPSLFFPNHLSGGPYDVFGVSIPGGPGCTLGHNRRIAWGMTNLMCDDADLYLETPHPTDPYRYRADAGPGAPLGGGGGGELSGGYRYLGFETIQSPIRVKGERLARPCAIRISRHGPILSDAFLTPEATVADGGEGGGFARGPLLAVRWTAHLPSSEEDATLGLCRARGWSDVVAALRHFGAPCMNVSYADVDGNFGYYVAGRIPIRANGKNILPADGASGEGEWTGFIPFEENPHVLNPQSGFLTSSNQKPVDDGYPYYISDFFEAPYRARRAQEVVLERGKLSREDGERFMLDVHSIQAKELVEGVVRPIEDRLKQSDGGVQVALNYLLNWDFNCTTDSIAASVFHLFYDELLAEVFREALGPDAYTQFLDQWTEGEHVEAVELILRNPRSAWFRTRPRDEAVAQALARAVKRLKRELGEATQGWEWGKLHKVTLRHAFHARPPLRKLFDIGPAPSPGGATTLDNSQWLSAEPFGRMAGGGIRHVADLSDLENGSRYAIPGGVSGNPASPWHKDLFAEWIEGKFMAMPMERAAIEKVAKETLFFEPDGA